MIFAKLCLASICLGALFGAAFVLAMRFAEWVYPKDDPPTFRTRCV
jgi:hypothetical protein